MSVTVVAPTPVRLMVWRPLTVLSSRLTAALRVPTAVGVKMKPMLQLAPESRGTVKLQLVVLGSMAKSDVLPEANPT